MFDSLPAGLRRVLCETPELKQTYLVGGCVRDWIMGIPHKDYDLEVFDLDYETLSRVLGRWGRVDEVGRSFGVIKLTLSTGQTFDFSVPRRDSKVSIGHKGFKVDLDRTLTPRDAAARRDYTINALMFNAQTNELLDFFGGQEDIRNKVLRHTSAAFPEDPLRVLRGMQFAARFELVATRETIEMARSIRNTFPELAKERVREEWFKWAEKSRQPSLGLRFLEETGWVEHFPELMGLRGIPQDPEWHPEGDVFTHTAHCCDELVRLEGWQRADATTKIVLMLAVLTHDFGKAKTTTTALRNGKERIVSPGHENESGNLAESFLERINAPRMVRERVVPLILNHMAHFSEVTDRAVRRLSKRLEPENIDNLLILMTADAHGRPPKPRIIPETVTELENKAHELNVRAQAPEPILQGRHLVACGYPPGRNLGELLRSGYEAQLAGAFHDLNAAYDWLLDNVEVGLPDEVRAAVEGIKKSRPVNS